MGFTPPAIPEALATLIERFDRLTDKRSRLKNTNDLVHLGTLGTGNHLIELCLDEEQRVWVMLPFALAGGGRFTTVKSGQHARTAAEIVARFTDRRTVVMQRADDVHEVDVR